MERPGGTWDPHTGRKSRSAKAALRDSNRVTLWNRQSYATNERSRGCRGSGREGRAGQAQGSFRAVNLLCVTLQWRTRVTERVSKATECTTQEYTDAHCGLWVTMTIDVGSRMVINIPLWCGMLTEGSAVRCVGAGGTWEIPEPSFSFAVNLKLL